MWDGAGWVRTAAGLGAKLVVAAVVVVAAEFVVAVSARDCFCPKNYGQKNLCPLAQLAEFEGGGSPVHLRRQTQAKCITISC